MNAISALIGSVIGQVKEGDPIAKGVRLLFIFLLLGGYLDFQGLQELLSQSGDLASRAHGLGSDAMLVLTALTSTNAKKAA